jgi:hypothetical protein
MDIAFVRVFKDRELEKQLERKREIQRLCDDLLAKVAASPESGPATLEALGWDKLHDLLDDFGEDDRGPTPVLAERLHTVLLERGGTLTPPSPTARGTPPAAEIRKGSSTPPPTEVPNLTT